MKKMLLMGYSGAGKTSMHSVIFANFPAKDTTKIGYTVERQEHKFKFMGTLTINLWDCGGQDTFMEQYFLVQKQTIFRGVQVLIYVFDIENKDEAVIKKSLEYWEMTLKSIKQYNDNANIFVLLHKIDKIPHEERNQKIQSKRQQVQKIAEREGMKIKKYFATSIWDQTLYQAWSQIVQLLIPNQKFIQNTLKNLCELSLCSEAVLFERSTFLILSHHDESGKEDLLKYEKVANIIKQFKLTCKYKLYFIYFSKLGANIQYIEVNTSSFTGLIQEFTKTENVMIIYKDTNIRSELISLNLTNLGKSFEAKKKQAMEKQIVA